jgi:putative resolvase
MIIGTFNDLALILDMEKTEDLYMSASVASRSMGVSACTLRRWAKTGKISSHKSPSGQRLYKKSELLSNGVTTSQSLTLGTSSNSSKQSYIYCRVSTRKQKADLDRQISHLQSLYPNHQVVSDIASGINSKRPGLCSLLRKSSKDMVNEIVVAQRDRLSRISFDLLEFVFGLHNTKIKVVGAEEATDLDELQQDMLAINTVFICKMQGKRAASYRRQRQAEKQAKVVSRQ